MPHVLISGGTGYVGRFIVEEALYEGWDVTVTGRTAPTQDFFSQPVKFIEAPLDHQADYGGVFAGIDYFIHAAFDHKPGLYRAGEGDDPEGFALRNLGGSAAMVKAAKAQGVTRVVFLSSRAVYGTQEPGMDLYEHMTARPDTLYGKLKLELEQIIEKMTDDDFYGVSLRVTGVYGPAGKGKSHKWESLFELFSNGLKVKPRAATEVHGEDVARAAILALTTPTERMAGHHVFNVSDYIIDHRDILAPLQAKLKLTHPLPMAGERGQINAMNCDRLKHLGWRCAGPTKFGFTIEALVEAWVKGR